MDEELQGIPAVLILLQNDTGSMLVFASFARPGRRRTMTSRRAVSAARATRALVASRRRAMPDWCQR